VENPRFRLLQHPLKGRPPGGTRNRGSGKQSPKKRCLFQNRQGIAGDGRPLRRFGSGERGCGKNFLSRSSFCRLVFFRALTYNFLKFRRPLLCVRRWKRY
jgi:hypothetical protein